MIQEQVFFSHDVVNVEHDTHYAMAAEKYNFEKVMFQNTEYLPYCFY